MSVSLARKKRRCRLTEGRRWQDPTPCPLLYSAVQHEKFLNELGVQLAALVTYKNRVATRWRLDVRSL